MSRHLYPYVALLMIATTIFTGCHPTQPFYFQSDGDLSHYLDRATDIEYPDVCTISLPDAVHSREPLTLSNPEFDELWDLTLEECISIALQNSKVIRNLGGVTPFGFADALLGRTAGSPTIYDPAITETSPSGTARSDIAPPGGGGSDPLLRRVTAAQAGGVEAALADFDALFWVRSNPLNAGPVFSRVDQPLNRSGQFASFTGAVQDQYLSNLSTGIYKKTATGARFTVDSQTGYDRWNGAVDATSPAGPGRKLRSAWTTQLEVRWDQPLLRGRGTMINRIPIILARMNTDISLAAFESSVRNLVLDLEDTYWNLHLRYRRLETAKIGRDSAQVTWKQVYEKRAEGVLAKQDEAQAREQYFAFRAAVETSLRELYDFETQLRFLMGIAAADGRLIRPINEPTMARVQFDWSAVSTETLVRSPELRQKKWQIKQRELELVSAKNQLLPQLDVGAFYRWVGMGDDLFGSSDQDFVSSTTGAGTSALAELAGGRYQEAGVVFNFSMPVGFRSAMAGVRNAQLQLVREKAQLEDSELNAIHLLNTAIRDLDASYILAETHFNRWSAAEVEVEAAAAQYQFGRGTLDLVLEAQRRRAQAQVDYYDNLIRYNQAIAEVHFRKGSLLEYNSIQLAEGPWPQKAYWDALGRARERDASYYLDFGWTRPAVVSRGPVDGHISDTGMDPMMMMVPEQVPAGQPTREPTPAQPAPGRPAPAERQDRQGVPEDLPPLEELGPVTQLRGPAAATGAVRPAETARAASEIHNPLRKSYDWGALPVGGSEVRRDANVQPASYNAPR